MKLVLKLAFLIVSITFYNCKHEESSFSDYKYAQEEQVITCSIPDAQLYNEALHSFEADILNYYKQKKSNIRSAYNQFLIAVTYNQIPYEAIVTPHTMKVLKALKNKPELWNGNNMNYNAQVFSCLTDNFGSKEFATTIQSLINTNSIRVDILAPPAKKYIKTIDNDKYLATFIALSIYYAQLVDIDPSTITEKPVDEMDH
ncbi:hypothetical protein SAMN04487989_103108 [Bizionia echini]|uniref:Uncharacterized protein n=1 Tax=Bizionia echini TaxID=649333 RepID=A0A1I5BFT1_9FLAO|nr:hypothetical protein [Bizionia echini]SFN73593.1 hypothetical protein SAMN04487989_103108 [Bizionia echini]